MSGLGYALPECTVTGDHWWHGGSICTACGERLRCVCGRFVREDQMDEHVKRCVVVEDLAGGCPICVGGNGSACMSHFV